MSRPVLYPQDEGVIVAFSGGKDSLVVLDLAVKHFARVEPFFMYFLPDLDYTNVVIDYAERRFGLKIRQYPHWQLSGYLRHGAFCDAAPRVREQGMQDVIKHARVETGLHWCGLGYRMQESMLQRRWLSRKAWNDSPFNVDGRWAPLREWKKRELLAYLRRERIVIPGFSAKAGHRPSGIDLSPDNLAILRANWPRDYERILTMFPWAAGQAPRKVLLDQRRADWTARRKAYDKARGSAASRGYGHAWRVTRERILAGEPYCRECRQARKLLVPARHVDHVIPRREFVEGRVAGDPDADGNLQPLCHECHSVKTALEDSHFAGARQQVSA